MPRTGTPAFYAGIVRALTTALKFYAQRLNSSEPLVVDVVRFIEGCMNEIQMSYDAHRLLLPDNESQEILRDYQRAKEYAMKGMVKRYATAINVASVNKASKKATKSSEPVVSTPPPVVKPTETVTRSVTPVEPVVGPTEVVVSPVVPAAESVVPKPVVMPIDDVDDQAERYGGAASLETMAAGGTSTMTEEELEIYASDNEDPMPLAYMSMLHQPPGYQPIQFNRDGRNTKRINPFARLGVKIRDERECRTDADQKSPGESRNPAPMGVGAWNDSYVREQERLNRSRSKSRGRRNQPPAVGGPSHRTSTRNPVGPYQRPSYKWLPQQRANGPVTGVPYPPMLVSRSMDVVLERNNPDIMYSIWPKFGLSEWVPEMQSDALNANT